MLVKSLSGCSILREVARCSQTKDKTYYRRPSFPSLLLLSCGKGYSKHRVAASPPAAKMAGSPTNLLPVIHFMANFCFAFGEGSALLRIWTKAVVLKSYGWDDFAMTIAAVGMTDNTAFARTRLTQGSTAHQHRPACYPVHLRRQRCRTVRWMPPRQVEDSLTCSSSLLVPRRRL